VKDGHGVEGLLKMTATKWGALIVVIAICLPIAADSNEAPTYKGLVCMGWVKPEAQAVADGDSEGDALVVNTPLTEKEKRELYYARQEEYAAMHKESVVEASILNHHHLLFPLSHGSDWMRKGPCGDTPMIRSGEYHITEFVPSNPKYPGNGNRMMAYYHADSAKCRAYFAELRKKAVKAKYGTDADEAYMPPISK
jgi:hypothetical protein